MKKYGLLLCCVIGIFPTAYAQRGTQARAISRALLTKPSSVSVQLQHRALHTYNQASNLERQLARTFPKEYVYQNRHASLGMFPEIEAEFASDMYPDAAPFLTTNRQLANYFTAQNNREILKYSRAQKEHYQQLLEQVPLLKERQQQIDIPTDQDMKWLAQQIPADTDYLLLGEQHGFEVIQTQMGELLTQLRARFTNREIILFTEFLPSPLQYNSSEFLKYWQDASYLSPYLPLWEKAYTQHIHTVGLEPIFRLLTISAQLTHVGTLTYLPSGIWSSPEGMRLRNQAWLEVLREFRQQHPDALFIVQAGFAHLDYTQPHSLGNTLKSQANTFVAGFFPGVTSVRDAPSITRVYSREKWSSNYRLPQGGFLPASNFDFATHGAFPQRLVQFTTQERELTGFDIQVKTPIPVTKR